MTVRKRASRWGGCFGSNAIGAQISAPSGNANRGGATPMTWCGSPSIDDAASDDRRVAVEAALPEAVAEDDDVMAAERLVVAHEAAAERRADAERVEEAGRHLEALQPLRILALDQVGVPPRDRRQVRRSCRRRRASRGSWRATRVSLRYSSRGPVSASMHDVVGIERAGRDAAPCDR